MFTGFSLHGAILRLVDRNGIVPWNGTVDLNFVSCPIVSKFNVIYSKHFLKFSTIIMCSQNVSIRRRCSTPWPNGTSRGPQN